MAVIESIVDMPAAPPSPNELLVAQPSQLVGYGGLRKPQFHAEIVDTLLLVKQGSDQAHPGRV